MDRLIDLYNGFFGRHVLVAPEYLLTFIFIAWGIYLYRRETGGFLRWLLPRDIWTHRSTQLDLYLFVLGRIMSVLGIVAKFGAIPLVASFVAGLLPRTAFDSASLSPIALAFMFWIVSDFALYWTHRAYHTIAGVWPLHAVHHSAAVLTPFTAYRQHPLGILLSASFQSVVAGTLLGLLVGVLDPQADMAEIAGVNAFVVLANLSISNFHHAHIWISFGPVLERVVISPAQHHIHHSTKPDHFNRNFGQTLAIWDWMFGTLYVTHGKEDITFGLNAKADAPLMTHRLGSILWNPVLRLFSHRTRKP